MARAGKVGMVTDTISCVTPEMAREYGVRVVPTGLVIDGKEYMDLELKNEEFWKLFYQAKEHPTTNAVSPGSFVAIFNDLAKTTDDIACIVVSRGLSATGDAATKARDIVRAENPKLNIEIVDSKTASGAQAFVVLEAARAAHAGKSLAEVVKVAQDMIPRVKFVVGMETLKYLIKSGRAPKTAIIGEMLSVKPVVGMLHGTGLVENLGRARGRKKMVALLAKMVKENTDNAKPVHFMFHYTDSIAAGEELRDMVTAQFKSAEVYLTPYTPVMSSQTGPVIAISFYS